MARLAAASKRALSNELSKRIVGQEAVVEQLITALFAGGHCLFVGVPGLAKTLLIQTLSDVLDLSFGRIQFTPDLMPSDITGSEILEEDKASGKRVFRFVKGPLFANIILADEINRTPPKTQAALLQSMQEQRVSAGGNTFALPSPFLVFATQNPIEQEGTYPLPEAQLDRFMFHVEVTYPTEAEERRIATGIGPQAQTPLLKVLSPAQILQLQELVKRVPVAEHVAHHAVALCRATRPQPVADALSGGALGVVKPAEKKLDFVTRYISWGAGPRASQNLILAAKARALLAGRFAATIEDVRHLAPAVLRHRIVPNFHAEADGVTSMDILEKLLATVRPETALA